MLFSISKQSFPKLPGQQMPMTGVISGVVTPKDKTNSDPLAGEKVRILSKSVVNFWSFPVQYFFFFVSLYPTSTHQLSINFFTVKYFIDH